MICDVSQHDIGEKGDISLVAQGLTHSTLPRLVDDYISVKAQAGTKNRQSILQYSAEFCSILQYSAVFCSILQSCSSVSRLRCGMDRLY